MPQILNSGRSGETQTSDGVTLVGRAYLSNQMAGANQDSADASSEVISWPSRGAQQQNANHGTSGDKQ